MTSPKHLWSGDWRADSAAAAEELAARRPIRHPEAEPEPEPLPAGPPRRPAPAPSPRRPAPPPRPRTRPTVSPRVRVLALIAVFALLAAGAGYGLTSALGTSKSRTAFATRAYLGLQIGSRVLTDGLLIESVSPGSPAQRAGIRAGDVLSRIGQVEVHSPGDVRALMQGRRPGDQVELGIERGPITFTVNVTLAARP